MKTETELILIGGAIAGVYLFRDQINDYLKTLIGGEPGQGGALGRPIFQITHPGAEPVSGGFITPAPVYEQVKYYLEFLMPQAAQVPADYSSAKIAPTALLTANVPAVNLAPAGVSGIAQSLWNAGAMQQGKTVQLQATSPATSVGLTGQAAALWNLGAAQKSINLAYKPANIMTGQSIQPAPVKTLAQIIAASPLGAKPFK